MSAKPLPNDVDDREFTIPFPTLYQPPPAVARPTCSTSGSKGRKRHKSGPGQKKLWADSDFIGDDEFQVAQAALKERPDAPLTKQEAAAIGRKCSLAAFYFLKHQDALVEEGLSNGTLSTYRNALGQWERYAPHAGVPGKGIPLVLIDKSTCDEFLANALRAGRAVSTVGLWRDKLRAILRFAHTLGVIRRVPKMRTVAQTFKRLHQKAPRKRSVATYSPALIETCYRAFASRPDCQVAFVLAINAGPRPSDLFQLRWEDIVFGDEPSIAFGAKKTGKSQRIPIAPVTIAHLERLRPAAGATGPVFPELATLKPVYRNAIAKSLLVPAGVTVRFPWKTARATCNTRLRSESDRVAKFVLGHAKESVNDDYDDPSEDAKRVINTLQQPACFMEILGAMPQGI